MKRHTPTEWANFFGIEIIDADGWEDREDFAKPITINEFDDKIVGSTIRVANWILYRNYEFICG